jgi:hypothetical protein
MQEKIRNLLAESAEVIQEAEDLLLCARNEVIALRRMSRERRNMLALVQRQVDQRHALVRRVTALIEASQKVGDTAQLHLPPPEKSRRVPAPGDIALSFAAICRATPYKANSRPCGDSSLTRGRKAT